MLNVLVTGAGGTLGQTIIKALKIAELDCKIITTNSLPWGAGLYRADKGYIVPEAVKDDYIDSIIKICKKEKVDVLFVGTEHELLKIAEAKDIIEGGTGAIVVVGSVKAVKIGVDKWITYRFLKRNNLNYAGTTLASNDEGVEEIIETTGFPVIVKPRFGSGSKNIFQVNNYEELKYAKQVGEDMLVQEYLHPDSEEYTVGVFSSKNYEILGKIAMKRNLLYGITISAIVDNFEEVTNEAISVAKALKIAGPSNIQLRLTKKGPVTFEINPRLSSTSGARAYYGFNEVLASIKHFVYGKNDVGLSNSAKGFFTRFWEEVFVPYEEYEKLIKNKEIVKSNSKTFNSF